VTATPQPCGTPGAYQRHKRNREDACAPCVKAHNEAERAYRAAGGPVPRPPAPAPRLDPQVRDLLDLPVGTILADRFGDAVQRTASGGFWVPGSRWPQLASEIVGQGPFKVLHRPRGGAS
jgi:hypothetical protein